MAAINPNQLVGICDSKQKDISRPLRRLTIRNIDLFHFLNGYVEWSNRFLRTQRFSYFEQHVSAHLEGMAPEWWHLAAGLRTRRNSPHDTSIPFDSFPLSDFPLLVQLFRLRMLHNTFEETWCQQSSVFPRHSIHHLWIKSSLSNVLH